MSQGYCVRVPNFQLVLLTVGLPQNIENVLDVLVMKIENSV